MSTTYYLLDTAVSPGGCGPGSRQDLDPSQGSGATTLALDATGDTWNTDHAATGLLGQAIGPGTWTANLYLAYAGFGGGNVNLTVARWAADCTPIETIMDEDRAVASASYTLHTFTATPAQVVFNANDLLMLILKENSGNAHIEYNQTGFGNVSLLQIPDVVPVRPHEYYKRQRRRRSA